MPEGATGSSLLPGRYSCERGVCLLTSGALCKALLQDSGGRGPWLAAACSLALLTLVAIKGEPLLGTRLGPRYRTRPAESTGLCLGLLTAPWVLAGLAVQQHSKAAEPHVGLWLPAAMTASALATLARVLPYLLHRLRQRKAQPAASDSSKRTAVKAQPWQLAVLAASAAGVAALSCTAAAMEAGSGLLQQLCAGLAGLLLGAACCACFHAAMRLLPRTLTIGEGLLVSQGTVLLAAAAARLGFRHFMLSSPSSPFPAFVSLLLLGSMSAAAVLIPLLQLAQQRRLQLQQARLSKHHRQQQQQHAAGTLYMAALLLALLAAAALVRPALWLLSYGTATRTRLFVLGYWAVVMAVSLPVMAWLAASRLPNILVRKGYHLLALLLFVPPLLVREQELLGAALAVAFALFVAAEVVRLSGIPRIGSAVHAFLTSFTDGRDAGLLLVTHFTLLLGMAAPLWLSNALQPPQQALWPSGLAGIAILGFGDTAASAVGRLLGRHPICRQCHKTLEGTAAGMVATAAAWWLLLARGKGQQLLGSLGAVDAWSEAQLAWLAGATLLSCLLEALTTQLDNLFVPCHYFALLCLL